MLVIAIGIHSAFEGLVVGVATDYSALFSIMIAILAHKWAEAITVGVSIGKAKMDVKMNILLIFIFAISTPIGISVGHWLSDKGEALKALMNALSAGTFLYISAVEIFAEEFAGESRKYGRFLASFIGVVMMIGVWYLEVWSMSDSEHGHNY